MSFVSNMLAGQSVRMPLKAPEYNLYDDKYSLDCSCYQDSVAAVRLSRKLRRLVTSSSTDQLTFFPLFSLLADKLVFLNSRNKECGISIKIYIDDV